jgi:hypothetical protein
LASRSRNCCATFCPVSRAFLAWTRAFSAARRSESRVLAAAALELAAACAFGLVSDLIGRLTFRSFALAAFLETGGLAGLPAGLARDFFVGLPGFLTALDLDERAAGRLGGRSFAAARFAGFLLILLSFLLALADISVTHTRFECASKWAKSQHSRRYGGRNPLQLEPTR